MADYRIEPVAETAVDLYIDAAAVSTAELEKNAAKEGISSKTEMLFLEIYRRICTYALAHNAFLMHCAVIEYEGRGYAFSAPSGTGKSTHTALWLERFGSRAQILNDDKPAIMADGGNITACGTPWSGKSDLNLNLRVPLRGICVLERSDVNFIEPLPPEKSVFSLLDQTLRPSDGERMGALLELLDAVTSHVPVWRMGCNISTEAAELAYKTMS